MGGVGGGNAKNRIQPSAQCFILFGFSQEFSFQCIPSDQYESESENTKFNTPAPHSHLRPCNTNESHDTGERKWLIGPNLDIFT